MSIKDGVLVAMGNELLIIFYVEFENIWICAA